MLVIPKLDRLGRSTRHLLETVERLETAGVRLVSLRDHLDTSTPTGRLLLRVLASVAEFESDMIGERVAAVSLARVEQGRAHGRAGYGYRSENGLLIVVEHEAAVVRRIFSEFADLGRSQRAICRDLNREGITTQRGGEWSQGTLAKVLSNPVYVGIVRVNGIEAEGVHEAIIDPETWRRTEQLRTATRRNDGGKGKSPRAGHVLAGGLLRCGRCGSVMGAVTKPNRTPGRLYEVYACTRRASHGIDCCGQPNVKRGPIDAAVWEFFSTVALDLDATRAAIADQHQAKLAELDALGAQAQAEVQQAQARLTRVRRDYQDGHLEADDWTEQRAELTTELEAAQAHTHQVLDHRQAVIAEADQIDTESAVLAELSALRATIVGEAREGSRESVDALRAALRRTFTHFELVVRGFGCTDGEVWQGEAPTAGGHLLIPHLAADALDLDAATFPALRKAALSLSRSDAMSLTT